MAWLHQNQEWVKVNVSVDAGVAELVLILSAFTELRTYSSCEEGNKADGSVTFYYGKEKEEDSWKDLANFVLGFLGPRLAQEISDRASLSIIVPPSGDPYAVLWVRKGGMTKTINTLKALYDEFSN